jgi:hypothetical protein
MTAALAQYGLLHKSIRDADYETMERLVEEDSSILWKRNSIGWTALHFAASHGLGTLARWKWCIELAAHGEGETQLYSSLTDAGDSPVNHFFLRELEPLPWQRPEVKQEATRRRGCIEEALNDERILECVREGLDPAVSKGQISVNETVTVVLDFLCRLQVLLKAATQSTQHKRWSLLHALSLTGCPRLVADLAIRLYTAQLCIRDDSGNLPLHIAAATFSPQSHPILIALVEIRPDTCSQLNANHHLPLHLALAAGKTGQVIDCLWNAHPLYGAPCDANSHLPAFLVAAVGNETTRQCKTIQLAASRAMWRFMPVYVQDKALKLARSEVELDELTTVYCLLRASPDAIACVLRPQV